MVIMQTERLMKTFSIILLKQKSKASGVHLIYSMFAATLVALLVFGLWYPWPYREISGGRELFLLIIGVDIIMGPLITFAIFSPRKPKNILARDIGVVIVMQLIALIYGLWTIALARPVFMVFEIDRFRVVHAVDVPNELLPSAPSGLRSLTYTGPKLLGLRKFKDARESAEFTLAALGGISLSSRPELWQSYELSKMEVINIARPIDQLKNRYPEKASMIEVAIVKEKKSIKELGYVPVVSRKEFGTALIDIRTGDYVGYLSVDSF